MRKACAKYVRTKSNEIKKGREKEREKEKGRKKGLTSDLGVLKIRGSWHWSIRYREGGGRAGSSTSRRQGSMFTRIHSNMKPKTAKSSG